MRAQFRPCRQTRAKTIQTTAAITPPAMNPATRTCWLELIWLADRCGERFSGGDFRSWIDYCAYHMMLGTREQCLRG